MRIKVKTEGWMKRTREWNNGVIDGFSWANTMEPIETYRQSLHWVTLLLRAFRGLSKFYRDSVRTLRIQSQFPRNSTEIHIHIFLIHPRILFSPVASTRFSIGIPFEFDRNPNEILSKFHRIHFSPYTAAESF